MQKAAHAYLSTQVTTTTQGDILIMLYDAAIKFLKQAKVYMAEKNYAQKGILISKAIDVIAELSESLNKEKGGELARNLSQLYVFCNTRLLAANLNMDPKMIDEVVHILAGLRSAYNQVVNAAKGGAAPTAEAPAEPVAPARPEPVVARPVAPVLQQVAQAPQPASARPSIPAPEQAVPMPVPGGNPVIKPNVNAARFRAANAYGGR